MSFWMGVYKGFSEEEDRRQRREEFQESLKQRQIETFLTLKAKREAEGDYSSGEYSELFTVGVSDTSDVDEENSTAVIETPDTEVSPEENPSGGFVARPAAPTTVEPTPAPQTAEEAVSKPPVKQKGDVNAKAATLLSMGANKDQVAEIWNLGGEPALNHILDLLRKNRGNTPYTPEELEDALGSVIITVERGGKLDDMKLWREMYPEVELSEADQAYIGAFGSSPQTKVSVEVPYFDTTVRQDKKPLSDTTLKYIEDGIRQNLLVALSRDRSQARAEGDLERVTNVEGVIKLFEESGSFDMGLALEVISEEEGMKVLSPYFQKYPELMSDPVFLGRGIGKFVETFQGGSRETSTPVRAKPSQAKATFTTHEDFLRAKESGQVSPGDLVIIEGQLIQL